MHRILNKEEIDKIIDKIFDEQYACDYCCYSSECDGNVKASGDGTPTYPPCCDYDMKNGEIDVYQYLEDLKEEGDK